MKNYQKAEMIAKNLPTGSYAAGCPIGSTDDGANYYNERKEWQLMGCKACEVTK